ncbi:MAG: M48 family metalloprotease [Nitrospirae bacterium]|nr:M48 family metalloprotease [Nitrospirota bacterium]
MLPAAASFAADQADPRIAARAKIERLLSCQQAEKDAALAEKRHAQDKISDIETFIRSLSDRPVHYAAHEKADRALIISRDALAKVEERVRLADAQLNLTTRAITYLLPELGVKERAPLDKLVRKAWDRLAHFANRHGQSWDEVAEAKHGFVRNPLIEQRLKAIVQRVQGSSDQASVPVDVRILAKPSGMGAAATASTIYFDQSYLDRAPSEDELLFIAGHELAHIQLNHYNKLIVREALENKLNSVRLDPVEGDRLTDVRDRIYQKYQTGQPLTPREELHREVELKAQLAQFAREQELQADLLGAQMALAAGASPIGIKEGLSHDNFFTRLKNELEERRILGDSARNEADNPIEKLTADHPYSEERLKALETALGYKFWERTDLKLNSSCPR